MIGRDYNGRKGMDNMEKTIYVLLGFAVVVLVVSIAGVFWSDCRNKKLQEKDNDEDREITDEINRRE
mgnify:CR=1 FL=1